MSKSVESQFILHLVVTNPCWEEHLQEMSIWEEYMVEDTGKGELAKNLKEWD